jgi:putative endonuclease
VSTAAGIKAEDLAAAWLVNEGYKILVRNWRTRFCEIDIVARKKSGLHFIEVKYRRSNHYGSGFDYITADKSRRLRRAAESWLVQNGKSGQYQIDVVAVSGFPEPQFVQFLPNAIISG